MHTSWIYSDTTRSHEQRGKVWSGKAPRLQWTRVWYVGDEQTSGHTVHLEFGVRTDMHGYIDGRNVVLAGNVTGQQQGIFPT